MKKSIIKLKKFLGEEVSRLIPICATIGFFSFLVETSFIFILQLFLVNLGLITKGLTFLPEWLPSTPLFGFITLLLFGILKSIAYGGKIYISIKTQQSFIKNQRKGLLHLSLTQGGNISTKEITAAFTELTTQAGSVIFQSSQLIIALLSSCLFLIYGAYLAPKEMILGFTLLVLIGLPFKRMSRKISSSGKKIVSDFSLVNQSLLLGLKNNFFISLYNMSHHEASKGNKYLDQYEENYLSYGRASSILAAFPVLSGVFIISVLTHLGTEYFNTPGIKLITFFYVFIRFAQAASDSFRINSFIRLNLESFKKLYGWSVRKDLNVPTNYSNLKINKFNDITISANELEFAYDSHSVFKNLNFTITKGDILLIKGRSGSGKSTLLNTILGLYKPTQGEIKYNGTPSAPENISSLIGYVGAEPYIIPGTIKENMQYGLQEEKTDQEIWTALKYAYVDEVIASFPLKLDATLSDSAEVSTGQKQRLSIARALLRQPKILVLDEATSNLDSSTEEKIISNIKELSTNVITIVVSHKDSFDCIATVNLKL